jgi:Secretion system C-terminal sorting domain/Bacterial pre-peptidase C-terminal domain/Fibronectin type III domain
MADRYVITEFNNKAETTVEGLTFAVSQTNDPTGAWYVYFFGTGTTFPDYPKFSVWPDAYYGTTNDFANGSSYAGSTVYAFDRAKMIAGNATATMQKFTLGNTNKFFSMSPVTLSGSTLPPTGSGGLIAYMNDNVWSGSTVDSIGLFEFKVNFTTPSATTVTTKSSLAVTAYKSDICTATRGQCITQPGTTTRVEALQQKIMNQPIYRNFGGYEGIVMSHVVDKGTNISGVRWYELTKTTGAWGVNQQSTYAPDNTNRFLPGICYDAAGNIGMAYNVASSATGVFPGARYTGRKSCDPLNSMTFVEDVLIAGTVSNGSTRYGDYNQLVADPDGVRFWFTCEYNGASTWSTRISSFTLDNCGATTCGTPTSLTSSAITTSSATVGWAAVSGATSYTVDYKLNTATTWTSGATATTVTSLSLSGLTAGSLYDFRVSATCAGGTSSFASAQFTTTAVVSGCVNAFEPNETQATAAAITNGATNSAAIESATDVDYFSITTTGTNNIVYNLVGPAGLDYDVTITNSAGTQVGSGTGSTATETVSLTNQAAGTYYIKVIGYNGANSTTCYTIKATATAVSTGCASSLDNSTNGTTAGAATIPFNTSVTGLINPTGDVDHYKFVITTGGTITVTLGTLPGDYDVKILNSAGTQVAISQLGGTSAETINYTAAAGTYYVQVYGYAGANSATVCYTLRVATGTASLPDLVTNDMQKGIVKLFPNPASNKLNVSVIGDLKQNTVLEIVNTEGKVVLSQLVTTNPFTIDVSKLRTGTYLIKVMSDDNVITTSKFVKE